MSAKPLMRAVKRRLLRYPFFPAVNVPFRAFDTWKRYIGPVLKNWVAWIFTSRADSNFTYPLTERCKINLAASLASILQTEYAKIAGYFREIEADDEFNGDSLRSLEGLSEGVDLFINDSDHSESYEQAEYELIKTKQSPQAIVLGDNSHVSPKLAEFSAPRDPAHRHRATGQRGCKRHPRGRSGLHARTPLRPTTDDCHRQRRRKRDGPGP
jgi:hypothetical protein